MSDFTPSLDEGRDPSSAAGGAAFQAEAAEGSRIRANRDAAVAHRVPVDSSRSMRAISGEVAALLGGLEERQCRSGALLASELIAQVVGRGSRRNKRSVEFSVQLRADAVHLEAMGPVAPALAGAPDPDVVLDDPIADWGAFLIDRLADRWGLNGGYRGAIWAEIAIPA
jgi:hypothetical protein